MAEPAAAAEAPALGTRADKIVIVMPAYNAARTIEDTFRAIPTGYYDEIVVVDDHSRDDTLERARQLNLKAIRHPHNVGYGGNQKTCYMEALRDGATIVVMLHPDGQYDPAIIPEMIRPIREGRAHMVLGSRMMTPGAAPCRRHAALEADREPLPDDARESRDGAALHGVPHRLPRLQPALPRDGAVPAQLERLRLRHRGDLPGRPLRACRWSRCPSRPATSRTPRRWDSGRASSTASARSGRRCASSCTAPDSSPRASSGPSPDHSRGEPCSTWL